jgi:hypothetical protein
LGRCFGGGIGSVGVSPPPSMETAKGKETALQWFADEPVELGQVGWR